MLLFAITVCFHLTSVWLCMSVVFAVTVQWPIGTNMTSPFSLFISTYPFSTSLKLPKSAKYLENMTTDTEKVWNILLCSICQSPIKCNVQVLKWIVDKVKKKKIITALWYSKVLQGRGTSVFKFQNVNCVSPQSKRFSFNFYWIPITLTTRLYQNELMISRKWIWWFHFGLQWFYRWLFVEFKNDLRVFKRFNFHFCQTLITLTMQIYYNKLSIKIGISHCDSDISFLLKKLNP